MTYFHLLPEIDRSIWNHVGNLDAKPERKARGIGSGNHRKQHITVPDEIILAMRRMHEVDRKPISQVRAAYPQFTESYVRRILGYELRANLKVSP